MLPRGADCVFGSGLRRVAWGASVTVQLLHSEHRSGVSSFWIHNPRIAFCTFMTHNSCAYLIFVTNAANAVRVKILAQCKKIPEEPEKYCFWQFCCKFTHFPSVKFSWLKMCACKKMTNIRYAININIIVRSAVIRFKFWVRGGAGLAVGGQWWVDPRDLPSATLSFSLFRNWLCSSCVKLSWNQKRRKWKLLKALLCTGKLRWKMFKIDLSLINQPLATGKLLNPEIF